MDKSQVFTLKTRAIQTILASYNPYFVLITRDPYVSCYRAASGSAGDLRRYSNKLSFDERFVVAVQHCKNCYQTVLSDSKYLNNFMVFKFEDFLLDIEMSTKRLCEFVNLYFDSSMLPADGQKIPFATKYPSRWFPIKKDVNSKYLSSIDSKYFDYVEKELGSLAESLGYHRPD